MSTQLEVSIPSSPTPTTADSAAALAEIQRRSNAGARIVFVSGNFNIVHPGHLRLLNFAAECGDFLVVGVAADGHGAAFLPGDLRLEAVRSIGVVGYSFILNDRPEDFIRLLKPATVVKGKEHENQQNSELEAVESYGGKLLFSSGDVRFSSLDLLQRELRETNFSSISKPSDFPKRHGFSVMGLVDVVRAMTRLKVVVMGDLIVDEYVNCDALGMSQEDPTIVVTPIKTDRFVGGAGIVSAHANGMGGQVTYFGVVGADDPARYAADTLARYGVEACLMPDDSRPTTLKQRFRANGKTLLRVSHLRQHDISHDMVEKVFKSAVAALKDADLLIFSDFSYGCLPQPLVDRLTAYCVTHNIMMVADSQTSSQVGDVSRFVNARLLTPTEHEARLATRDFSSGLVSLAETLCAKALAEQLIITLAGEGLLIHAPGASEEFMTDRLPAFNSAPKDVSGAGDSFLTCASMALAVDATIWQAAYLGSIAAACQVGRVGNTPLSAEELIKELQY